MTTDMITSFNGLFEAARERKLFLNSFHQGESGVFIANWRSADGKVHHDFAQHERPFDAARDSFYKAVGGTHSLVDMFKQANDLLEAAPSEPSSHGVSIDDLF